MFWSFTFVGAFCEFGERVSNSFTEVNKITDQMDWYLFPNEIQRMLPTFFIAFQRPSFFQGYGNIIYQRITFKQVSILSTYWGKENLN